MCGPPGIDTHGGRDGVGKVTEPLAQRDDPQACALATPVEEGVELRAQPLADRSRHAHQFAGEFVECIVHGVSSSPGVPPETGSA